MNNKCNLRFHFSMDIFSPQDLKTIYTRLGFADSDDDNWEIDRNDRDAIFEVYLLTKLSALVMCECLKKVENVFVRNPTVDFDFYEQYYADFLKDSQLADIPDLYAHWRLDDLHTSLQKYKFLKEGDYGKKHVNEVIANIAKLNVYGVYNESRELSREWLDYTFDLLSEGYFENEEILRAVLRKDPSWIKPVLESYDKPIPISRENYLIALRGTGFGMMGFGKSHLNAKQYNRDPEFLKEILRGEITEFEISQLGGTLELLIVSKELLDENLDDSKEFKKLSKLSIKVYDSKLIGCRRISQIMFGADKMDEIVLYPREN